MLRMTEELLVDAVAAERMMWMDVASVCVSVAVVEFGRFLCAV